MTDEDGTSLGTGTPQLLRVINERHVLQLIRQAGAISRAELARSSGLSKPTVSQALGGLLEAGLVHHVGQSSGGKGPRANLYELNPGSGWVAGIDVGRHWVRAAVADITGEIAARRDDRARTRSTGALVAQIGEIARATAAEAGIDWDDVTHAAIGSPGVLDPARERLEHAPNLPDWGRQGLVGAIRDELGTGVSVENDVNLAALGEYAQGAGRHIDDFVLFWVGTGVGMGIIAGGRLYRGAGGAAGEIGYLPIGGGSGSDETAVAEASVGEPDGGTWTPGVSAGAIAASPRSAAGSRGQLEESIAASGIVARARRLGMTPPLTPKKVFTAAARDDKLAREVVAAEARDIAAALAVIAPVVNPALVILGGGIGANDLLLEPVRVALAALTPFRPRLALSKLGQEAVLQGAVAIALEAAQERLFSRTKANHTVVTS